MKTAFSSLTLVLAALVVAGGPASGAPPQGPDFAGEWTLGGEVPLRGAYSGLVVIAPLASRSVAVAGEVRFASGSTERWSGVGTIATDRLALSLRVGGAGFVGALGGSAGATSVSGEWLVKTPDRLAGARGPARDELVRVAPGLRDMAAIERLDGGPVAVPQVNSNHPEVLTAVDEARCIAVSTLRRAGRAQPDAHLELPLSGRFKVFASNSNRTGRDLYRAIVLANEGTAKVSVHVAAFASADTREVPYNDLAPGAPRVVVDPTGALASGPGEAVASRITRGVRDAPEKLEVAPGAIRVLRVLRHVQGVELMTMADLESDGPVGVAILYDSAAPDDERARHLLATAGRVPLSAKDPIATAPGASGPLIFGRVAGVVKWAAFDWRATNDRDHRTWTAVPGKTDRFALDTKRTNTLGTGVDDAAPLLARYQGSAYASHGNYGASMRIEALVRNPFDSPAHISVFVDSTPGSSLSRWLRNTFEVVTTDALTKKSLGHAWVHVSLLAGQESVTPIASVEVPPRAERILAFRLDYAANNTPPHVLRLTAN